MTRFAQHAGYARTFQKNKLTLGMIFPLEAYEGNVPEMNLQEQIELAKKAERAKFASLFVRDIPLNDPMFGDVGQMYDPWIFLSYLAAHTNQIGLGTASAITSFQHPINLAKSAASLDKISNGRLLLGLATGDRTIEFKAFKVNRDQRATLYREAIHVMKALWHRSHPTIHTDRVQMNGETDLLPKPVINDIPVFITGRSGQTIEWIAKHGDGWINYPRSIGDQEMIINDWRSHLDTFKPFTQSLYLDLLEDPDAEPQPIHLGFRTGRKYLLDFLHKLEKIGVNHVILTFKFAERPIDEMIQELAEEVVPYFPAHT